MHQLKRYVLWPQTYPDQFLKLGLRPPRGILLYGPPGCSKTTLAKILAVQSGYQFFALSAASILDSHVGESERNLRACFALANQVGPSIIFLDEVDVLGQRQSSAETNVMSTLLNLMDGMEELQVLVLGATNYPDRLDSALIRVGRFDRLMYIGPPDLLGRKAIFQYYLSKSPTQANISLDELAEKVTLNFFSYFQMQ
ncbi:AAA+-type ATPase [Coelomomyces lativittatus]|nr:AAA+-type ATPase [Coelomomyces lativittatus]